MKYKSIFLLLFAFCIFPLVSFDNAAAQNLNIDLGAHFGTPSSTFAAASGQAGTWNTLGLGATSNLLDITGTVTAVSAAVTADDGDGWADNCTGDIHSLTDDNIYSDGNPWSVVLSGLTNGAYTVYLYNPTNIGVIMDNATVNGVSVPSTTGHGCALVAGSNFTTVQASVVNGTLTISGTASGFTGLAALQLIQQQPATVASVPSITNWGILIFMMIAGFGAVYYLRRKTAS